MNSRLAASGLAAAMTLSMAAAAPAFAATSPQPCAVYPAGQTFNFSAVPSRVTINKGSNVILNAVVSRGANHVPCDGYLTVLRYGFAPDLNQQAKRTNSRGVAPYIGTNIRSNRTYFFVLYYGALRKRSADVGQIFVN